MTRTRLCILFALLPAFSTGCLPQNLVAQLGWTQPTVEELTMTSEAKAPGAPAVVLSYEETDDGDSAEVSLHVRIKILTEGGLNAATVELPERLVRNDEFDRKVTARIVHKDGSTVEFRATAQNSIIEDKDTDHPRRVLTLSGAEVGSIVEYTCHFANQNTFYTYLVGSYAPIWHVQQKFFVRQAHFGLKLPPDLQPETTRWVANLPSGAAPVRSKGRVTLDLHDIPAYPQEDYMPPTSSVYYSVRFFYFDGPRDKYWGLSGGRVDDEWLLYMKPSKPIVAAAHDLTLPGDSDEVKLHKLYDAVQRMENTDLTRARTEQEDKHAAAKSEDVWTRRRGTSDELALLFVALARAAGYQAYPIAVSSRGYAAFDQNVLSWSQMDDIVAIVNVKGHEIYFDPGVRACAFAELAPWHSNVMGVSTEAKMVKIRLTPTVPFSQSRTERAAELTVTTDGEVTGAIRIGWLGNAGLSLRRRALREDTHAVEQEAEQDLSKLVPPSVTVKLVSLEHLNDTSSPLLATFRVSGKLGAVTSKRLILPNQFFSSEGHPLLSSVNRVTPVAFPAAYVVRDQVLLHFPAGYTVEALPEKKTVNLGTDLVYDRGATALPGKDALLLQRTLILSKLDYTTADYPELRKDLASIASADQEQVTLLVPAKGKP